jgi:hexosaminidase
MIIPKPFIHQVKDGAFAFDTEVSVLLAFEADAGYAHFVAEELAQQIRVAAGCFVTVKAGKPEDAGRGDVVLTDTDVPGDLGNEGYSLTITQDQITLRASHNAGLFYAAQSLRQLLIAQRSTQSLAAADNSQAPVRELPCVDIKDTPRFAWRGFMLDSARHFQPVDLIIKLIDQLAALKLNRFHWHLTDDQGWRLEVLGYPKLTSVGAWRSNGQGASGNTGRYGGYYTQEQVREVVAYAKQRQIVVIPEIEMPAHNLASLAAYPEFGCHDGPSDVTNTWGLLDGVYCAGKDQTFAFLNHVLDEVAELFPSTYLHLGGDERKPGRWDDCTRCRAVREKHDLPDEAALHRWFMDRVAGHVHTTLNRRSISWGDNIDAGGTQGQIVHGWLPEQSTKAARQGLDTINSTNQWVYLDYPETEKEKAENKPDWMKVLPLEKVYEFDPIPQDLESDLHHHIIGSEAPLWTEHVPTEADIHHQLWPRLIAFSETVWSPIENRDFEEFKKRLAVQLADIV